jgi:hypothetical protein
VSLPRLLVDFVLHIKKGLFQYNSIVYYISPFRHEHMHNSHTRGLDRKEHAATPRWMGTYKGRKEDPPKHLHRKKPGYGEPANHPMKIPSPHIAQSH